MPPKVQPGDEPFTHIDFPPLTKQKSRSWRGRALLLAGALVLLAAGAVGMRGRE